MILQDCYPLSVASVLALLPKLEVQVCALDLPIHLLNGAHSTKLAIEKSLYLEDEEKKTLRERDVSLHEPFVAEGVDISALPAIDPALDAKCIS